MEADTDTSLFQANDREYSDNSDEENESGTQATQFDIRLPVNHSYLQSNELGELSAETSIFLDPGKEISVPLFVMENVLLPGQSLPLNFTAESCVNFVRKKAKKHSYFCLSTVDPHADLYQIFGFDSQCMKLSSSIGTLFQVKNIGTDDDRLTIQAIGRRRCRLLRSLRHSDVFYNNGFIVLCKKISVVVLDDVTLPPLIYCPDLSFNKLPKKLKDRYYKSSFHNDAFAITQSSTESVVQWLKTWLQKWHDLSRINIILEQGYTAFSYWVASNLPVDLNTKLKFLEEECTNIRLRMEWRIATKITSLACSACNEIIFYADDVINLSVEGNGMHFVNITGYVHEMFTVSQVHNVEVLGTPTTNFTWFPGYSWTVLHCGRCFIHIGWRFSSSKLLPKFFYGVTRRTIKFRKLENDNSIDIV